MLTEEGKIVKAQLENFNQAKRRLKNLQTELEYWKNMGGALSSPSLEPHFDGGKAAPYAEKRVQKIEDLQNLISSAIDTALELEDHFLENIQDLDPLSQNLLMERYMTGKSLNRIIREFNYSERNIYYLYDRAFDSLAKKRK